MSGVIFYDGPSLLTGERVVGILSGLDGETNNPKTGPMIQAWVLVPNKPPMDAVRTGEDEAICGDCKLRGRNGYGRGCYVTPFFGPTQIWKTFAAGKYRAVTWDEIRAVLEGRGLRLCAYGDPAAVPFEIWRLMVKASRTHVGYTHSWRTCDQRLKTLVMASVDTTREAYAA